MLHRGFPAHAGMDPGRNRHAGTCDWFPRPRGDGPYEYRLGTGSWMVSPPTRGWTAVQATLHQQDAGFPAHAGMDP